LALQQQYTKICQKIDVQQEQISGSVNMESRLWKLLDTLMCLYCDDENLKSHPVSVKNAVLKPLYCTVLAKLLEMNNLDEVGKWNRNQLQERIELFKSKSNRK